MSDARFSRADFERLVFEAYRTHGWPMDPSKFAESLLRLIGVTVEEDGDE